MMIIGFLFIEKNTMGRKKQGNPICCLETVLGLTDLKASRLYIAQVKRKRRALERTNYKLSHNENTNQPACTPERAAAIAEAWKHLGMI